MANDIRQNPCLLPSFALPDEEARHPKTLGATATKALAKKRQTRQEEARAKEARDSNSSGLLSKLRRRANSANTPGRAFALPFSHSRNSSGRQGSVENAPTRQRAATVPTAAHQSPAFWSTLEQQCGPAFFTNPQPAPESPVSSRDGKQPDTRPQPQTFNFSRPRWHGGVAPGGSSTIPFDQPSPPRTRAPSISAEYMTVTPNSEGKKPLSEITIATASSAYPYRWSPEASTSGSLTPRAGQNKLPRPSAYLLSQNFSDAPSSTYRDDGNYMSSSIGQNPRSSEIGMEEADMSPEEKQALYDYFQTTLNFHPAAEMADEPSLAESRPESLLPPLPTHYSLRSDAPSQSSVASSILKLYHENAADFRFPAQPASKPEQDDGAGRSDVAAGNSGLRKRPAPPDATRSVTRSEALAARTQPHPTASATANQYVPTPDIEAGGWI